VTTQAAAAAAKAVRCTCLLLLLPLLGLMQKHDYKHSCRLGS
jgi:hypothetical protein